MRFWGICQNCKKETSGDLVDLLPIKTIKGICSQCKKPFKSNDVRGYIEDGKIYAYTRKLDKES